MNERLISFDDVTIRYPDGTHYPNLSFHIKKGKHWAFVGTNELLKTALLEALAGNANVIFGKRRYPFFDDWRHGSTDPLLSPQRLIQLVSFRHPFRSFSNTTDFYYQQRFNSFDANNVPTVQEYLRSITPPVSQPTWTFEKVVTALNLHRLLNEEVIKLSNGETKRVLLAAALLRNPVLLLLQHPLAGLDIAARKEITLLLNEIANSGITLIMTAAPDEMPEAITHVAVFNNAATFTTLLKKDFESNAITHAPVTAIDTTEVQALLAERPMLQFNTIIGMKDVTIRYGDATILDAINWTVLQGERWALTGHNGSGKSTLLSLINGDNPQAFANDIILFDRKKGSGESIWDIKKKIGFFSPELYQYFPVETSCLQAVECGFYDTIGLFRASQTYTAGIARRWMKLLGVEIVANKLLKSVPPVQQRLCLLARALVKNPPLLLLDEPCQGFSESEMLHFRHLVDVICSLTNITLIYVSHYETELPTCITKRLRLQNGKRVQAG